ncbi:MAG: imidazoleglycerol-phosphate dehydratase HisB [Tissierellia bacterium]|nr:imidazoleglycerol-phosphate dehydratase HisB [Tissierellia bacterium]
MRTAKYKRDTTETKIEGFLDLDGKGIFKGTTGLGFLDHMLTLFAFHGSFDLELNITGDLHVDSHHTMEDCGIVLGTMIREALGDRMGIYRYGSFTIPMDETLISVYLDISNRPVLVYGIRFTREYLGECATEDFGEFFRGLTNAAGMTLHLVQHYGENNHHIIEGAFKAFGRALRQGVTITGEGVSSTKGLL